MGVKMKHVKLLVLVVLLVSICGCAVAPVKPTGDLSNPIKRLAVLPFRNDTTDVDAPVYVRERLIPALEKRYYNILPVEETDVILREQLGITLGGQLEMASVEKLKEVLQVEGLLYGTIMDFGETTTGLVNVRKVRGKFEIVDTNSDTVFWKNGVGVRSLDTSGGTAGAITGAVAASGGKDEGVPWVTIESKSSDKSVMEGFALGLTKKLVSKAVGVHLQRETDEMIWRLVQNLPWGPGDSAYAGEAVAATAPMKVDMPKMRMPAPPSFGHMDYGDRDFSAVMTATTFDKTQQKSFSLEMPIAKAGEKFRMELDYGKMTGAENMPAAMQKMIMIHRGDEKKTYSIYPNKKKYMISEETDEGYYQGYDEEPDIKKTFVGNEVIDGHPTEKYAISISYQDEDVQEGFVWNATDLDGMTIKSEFDNPEVTSTTLLTNIDLSTPADAVFVVPAGFTETENFMELMMPDK
jgi:hypothetical protein